jgi:hypothetical protein
VVAVVLVDTRVLAALVAVETDSAETEMVRWVWEPQILVAVEAVHAMVVPFTIQAAETVVLVL